VDFVVCALAVKKKKRGRFRHVGSDHSLVSVGIGVFSMWSEPRCYEQDSLKQRVQLISAREAEKRWRYSQLRVKSPAVKRRLYVCRTYSETVIITALKSVARIQLVRKEKI
jgi:hypothetical protein